MNSEARLQLGWVRSEPSKRRLPHQLRRHGEDQRRIDLHRQPRRRRQFLVELTWRPRGAADDDAGAVRGRFLQQLQRQLVRHGQDDAWTNLALLVVRPLGVGAEHPRLLRLDRAADPQPYFGIDFHRRVGLDHRPGRILHLAVHHEPESALFRVIAEQDDRLREIWIRHLRHREEQDRRGARHIRIIPLSACGVYQSDIQVPAQAGHLRPGHRRALDERAQLIVRSASQFDEARQIQTGARLPRRIRGRRCRLVVRTDLLTDVAAIHLRADCRVILRRHFTAMFNRQVRQAPRGIEHARFDERAGRARLQASGAAAALLEPLAVGLESERCDDLAEEKPRPELGVDQTRVLANPAQPGVLRVNPLLNRTAIHVRPGLEPFELLRPERATDPRKQSIEAHLQDVVIVVAPGISGDTGDVGGEVVRVRSRRVVERGSDYNAARVGNDPPDIGTLVRRAVHPCHGGRVATLEPLRKERELRIALGARNAAEIESELPRTRLDRFGSNQLLATNCRTTYGRMPPWRKATSSSGVSMRTVTLNSSCDPPAPVATTFTLPRGFKPSATPRRLNSSVPVSFSSAAVCPALNSSGSTPMFTRLLRCMRSNDSAMTAFTPN